MVLYGNPPVYAITNSHKDHHCSINLFTLFCKALCKVCITGLISFLLLHCSVAKYSKRTYIFLYRFFVLQGCQIQLKNAKGEVTKYLFFEKWLPLASIVRICSVFSCNRLNLFSIIQSWS